jgi:hypothetical protein
MSRWPPWRRLIGCIDIHSKEIRNGTPLIGPAPGFGHARPAHRFGSNGSDGMSTLATVAAEAPA